MVVDEPTTLPEGTVLDLVIDDEGDDLDPEERRAIDEAIAKSASEIREGRFRTAEEVIEDLRKRRRP